MIRNEHVQHLSGADSIKELNAKLSFPFFAEMSRQRFTRRDTQAQARTVELRSAAVMFEQQVVNDRNAKEDCWALLREDSCDHIRRWFLPAENCCRSVQQRKRKTVTEAVGERQSRRGEKTVFRGE